MRRRARHPSASANEHAGLQPQMPNGLGESRPELDVDVIPGFDHLLGRPGKPGLVAIDRRDWKSRRNASSVQSRSAWRWRAYGYRGEAHAPAVQAFLVTSARLGLADDRHFAFPRAGLAPAPPQRKRSQSVRPIADESASRLATPGDSDCSRNIGKPAGEESICQRCGDRRAAITRHRPVALLGNRTTPPWPSASMTVKLTKPGLSGR